MISWAKSTEALSLAHDHLEERAMADRLEVVPLLAQSQLMALDQGDRYPPVCLPVLQSWACATEALTQPSPRVPLRRSGPGFPTNRFLPR